MKSRPGQEILLWPAFRFIYHNQTSYIRFDTLINLNGKWPLFHSAGDTFCELLL